MTFGDAWMKDPEPPTFTVGQWWEARERHVLRADGSPWSDKGEDPRAQDGPRRVYVVGFDGMSVEVLPRYTPKPHYRDDPGAYKSCPHVDCAWETCLLDLEGRIPIEECFVEVGNLRSFSCLEERFVRDQLAARRRGPR